MDHNFFIKQMTGNWFVQNTKYSLLKKRELTDTFATQIKWTRIQNKDKYFGLAAIGISDYNILSSLNLYCIQLSDSDFLQNSYIILVINSTSGQDYILKYNHKFNFINKFTVTYCSKNYLSMTAKIKEFTITEKIYFLHNNLKITKSIIRRKDQCIGTSFSSEIRIS